MSKKISFKTKQVTKKILSDLSPRAHEVIRSRFGLTDEAERKTLESIGQKYGITRERVRQIESAALNLIRKSDKFKNEKDVFEELKALMHAFGAIVSEHDFINHISKDKNTQNHIHLYLTLSEDFTKHKEDNHFKTRWSVNSDISELVHDSLKKIYESISDEELVAESKLISKFLDEVKDL